MDRQMVDCQMVDCQMIDRIFYHKKIDGKNYSQRNHNQHQQSNNYDDGPAREILGWFYWSLVVRAREATEKPDPLNLMIRASSIRYDMIQ